jgi:hypothetical protein
LTDLTVVEDHRIKPAGIHQTVELHDVGMPGRSFMHMNIKSIEIIMFGITESTHSLRYAVAIPATVVQQEFQRTLCELTSSAPSP